MRRHFRNRGLKQRPLQDWGNLAIREGTDSLVGFLSNPKREAVLRKAVLKDPTVIFLILSNILTAAFAIWLNWSVAAIVWTYWIQSVIIGFFYFFKILQAKTAQDPRFIYQPPVYFVALFFAFHYGFFHLIYAGLLSGVFGSFGSLLSSLPIIAVPSVIFFISHLFSFLYYLNKPKVQKTARQLMFEPYVRILPMHLTVMFVGFLMFFSFGSFLMLVIFIFLKTIADVFMHAVEHTEQISQQMA
ncbi:MAG TPA: hypothetical protein HA227_03735 [Candidatus Diapherotrites archaeon]|uniref:Uncharacterized protein n=1 Tax=Candidatus Iainarchaeum sp. TaxID=3101447 RepID=A0A7J4KVR4_9ARCH|nr:hypothetical protein [Candidatus Diapherotrites archaeon]